MFPTICDGDTLLIDTYNSDYKINDIVVFYSNEPDGIKLTAHRITHNFGNRILITKGDNNPYEDPPVRFKRILGKVVGKLGE